MPKKPRDLCHGGLQICISDCPVIGGALKSAATKATSKPTSRLPGPGRYKVKCEEPAIITTWGLDRLHN
jgi:hypothetical protein